MVKILVSHPTGNRNVRAVISTLDERDMLNTFSTTIAINPGSIWLKLLPEKVRQELIRRSYTIDFSRIVTRPFLEVARNILPRLGLKNLVRHEIGIASIDKVYSDQDKNTAKKLSSLRKNGLDAVYAYEDGALATFESARTLDIKCIYDLPIGYWKSARNLLKSEQERWPEWAATLTGFNDSDEKISRKDAELAKADIIFVASSFTASTLNEYVGKLAPIKIIPYGFPAVAIGRKYADRHNAPIKLLFVGGLSQRKGIADLFAAVDNIGRGVELTVVGRKPNAECPALDAALERYNWIQSLPHEEVLKLMQEHDVLIFPSLFEGFGLVITEAMSQGTPVITTNRTAGPDLITHNVDGWIVQAGSTEALQNQIQQLIANPLLIKNAGLAAMKKAAGRPWSKYGLELSDAIINYLQ